MTDKLNVFWFRRDLRYFDNHGFYKALMDELPVMPVFIFDANILDDLTDLYDKRVNFIYHKLSELNQKFLEHQSSILVKFGKPTEVFGELMKQYNIDNVFANHDYEPYARKRDERVENLLRKHGVSLHTFKDQVIFEKSEVEKDTGKPYSIYTAYNAAWKNLVDKKDLKSYPSEEYLFNLTKNIHEFPIMEDIGFKPSFIEYPSPYPSREIIKNYHKTRDYPSLNGTTQIGIHLRYGCVSIRQMMQLGQEYNQTWMDELIWREFFMMILYHNPYVVKLEYKPKYRLMPWRHDEDDFERWAHGVTGFPLVDAGMRELNETGYMHNRVRMVTASFLTKHLLIDWRWGEAYFAEKLLDYELASNNGNWQWAAGTGCDAAPYFRIFNPTTQIQRFDPDMNYVHHWIKDINELSYPAPMIDHKQARDRALATYKDVLNSVE